MSTAHRLKLVPNSCEQPEIRMVLIRAARAALKRGVRPRKKTAITLTELEAMLATCDDRLEGLRDRALLCFAFASGGRCRSEVATADLRRIGPQDYMYPAGAQQDPAVRRHRVVDAGQTHSRSCGGGADSRPAGHMVGRPGQNLPKAMLVLANDLSRAVAVCGGNGVANRRLGT